RSSATVQARVTFAASRGPAAGPMEPALGADAAPNAGSAGECSGVLEQPDDVAVRVREGGDAAAAADLAHGFVDGATGGRHLGQLGLDVVHLPVRDGRCHVL